MPASRVVREVRPASSSLGHDHEAALDEDRFMARALELARRAEGNVSPRPPVGSVIVRDGDVVGEGWTEDGEGLHAEVAALHAAGSLAIGATCYATLEPCVRWCAPALIEAGVARVVVATSDPNPDVDGRGHAALRDAGIEVAVGVCADEARALVEPFAKWVKHRVPFVTLKLAATLDGKVAAPDGTSRWITGEEARNEVHDLRSRVDAVCVGSGTVLADDPSLTHRLGRDAKQPLRVVIATTDRLPAAARFRDGDAPTLVITADDVGSADGGVDLDAALRLLAERGACHVLVEGGPTLASSFVAAGLVDRLILYLAPTLIGGDAPGLLGAGVKTLTDAWRMTIEDVRRVGDDLRIDARPEAA